MSRAAAWGVHLLTASGAVLALLALDAVLRNENHEALLWLLIALLVDGVDGTLARRLHVTEHLPRIDGAALDLVVDYLNYVLVPVLIIWRGEFLPPTFDLWLCVMVMLSSLYVFVRRDMKTEDGYFRGFPALWNVVAAYFVIVPLAESAAALIVLALVALTFAPIHVVHPFRSHDSRMTALAAAAAWLLSTGFLALAEADEPGRQTGILVSIASLGVLVAIGLRRTWQGAR